MAKKLKREPEVPPRVRLPGKTYTVEVVTPDTRELVEGYNAGYISHQRQRIYLNGAYHPDQMRDTLFHEIIHGCEEVFGFSAPEEYVHALSSTLLGTLKDNPEVVHYILTEGDNENGT